MTRTDSQMVKGLAILLMIFGHLFFIPAFAEQCHNIIFIGNTPLVSILARAANPVAFFLIVGGYGLFKVNERGDRHRWSRILKLMIHYWIVLAVFVAIGHFMYPARYPGSAIELLQNVLSSNPSYNGEMWFLFPYVILSACAPWLFRLFARFKAVAVVAVTLFIHLCTSFVISRYGASHLYSNHLLYNPLLVFHLLFNFSLGAMAAREKWFEHISEWLHSRLRNNHGLIIWGG